MTMMTYLIFNRSCVPVKGVVEGRLCALSWVAFMGKLIAQPKWSYGWSCLYSWLETYSKKEV